MKQSEPVNPRSLRTGRSAAFFHGSAIAAEISGYADIGMKQEALRLTRKLLQKRRILPNEFSEALRTVGIYASFKSFKKWKPKFEAAYERQSWKFKRKVRSDMLAMYVSLKEWETALQFVSIQRPSAASDFFFGMDVLLELGKVEEAHELSMHFGKALRFAGNEFEQSLLSCALGRFFAHTHQWEFALAVWQARPPASSIARNVLNGIVEIHLARALEAVDTGIRLLTERKQQHSSDIDLCLPRLEFELAVDAEKELLNFKRGIEKLLSEDARKDLGISTENT
jgi:hypothetical protein